MATKTSKVTTDYEQFKFIINNRQTARAHINKLKNAITKNPEILEVQPILVNENMEIIDGQHRFTAASELGLPIHYTVVKGIGIETARDMNVLQRRWHMDDYAYSYAKAGNLNYKAYNVYRREHPGISGSILISVMSSVKKRGQSQSNDFRSGNFVIERDRDDIEYILNELEDIKQITMNEIPMSRSFVAALLIALDNEDFKYDDFKSNLKAKPEQFHRVSVVRDGLRMIEDIHNFKKSTNLIRLY